MRKFIVLTALLLSTIAPAWGDARINCPWHGIQTVSSSSAPCPECEAKREREEEQKRAEAKQREYARQDQLRMQRIAEKNRLAEQRRLEQQKMEARNEIFEKDLKSFMEIDVRSFTNTNLFYAKCWASITNNYCSLNGELAPKMPLRHKMRIVQHIGYCEDLVDVYNWNGDDWESAGWCKIYLPQAGDNLADDEVGWCCGWQSNELYEYITVMGAVKRVKVFHTISLNELKEPTPKDIFTFLDKGGTLRVDIPYTGGIARWVKVSKNRGKIVLF